LKLAYVHLSVQKFSGGYTPDSRFKGEGRKAKGRVGLEGREWEGKKDQGKEMAGGSEDSEG
jgi:hypothetical protein